MNNELEDVLVLYGFVDKKDWTHYQYESKSIPRVTEILSETIGKEYLTKWAANLGKRYFTEKKIILDTGTLVHELIDSRLVLFPTEEEIYRNSKEFADIRLAERCLRNFDLWLNKITKNYTIEALALEKKLVCPLYGGTLDFLCKINNKVYILDFKTSKSISVDYFYQLMLYKMAMDFNRNKTLDSIQFPIINGLGVIRVDKYKENSYEFLLADYEYDSEFLNNVEASANNMLRWFYSKHYIDNEFKRFNREYKDLERWL